MKKGPIKTSVNFSEDLENHWERIFEFLEEEPESRVENHESEWEVITKQSKKLKTKHEHEYKYATTDH